MVEIQNMQPVTPESVWALLQEVSHLQRENAIQIKETQKTKKGENAIEK
jgi:hypothetical protein